MNGIYRDEQSGEWFYPENTYLLSETDEFGVILYANDLFCQLAGYKREELLGEAHNIVRDPDMPRIAFAGLWDDIRSKGFWTGFVKNRCKNGDFYWVFATVLKKVSKDGVVTYLSLRVKPSRQDVEASQKLYAELKAQE